MMKNYKEGYIYKRTHDSSGDIVSKGDLAVLIGDIIPGDNCSRFLMLTGESEGRRVKLDKNLFKRIWPFEKDTVIVVCEGKETEISRESAKALNLI